METIYAAGAVLVDEKNRVYLIYKKARDEWAVPKGKIRRGESKLQAALREAREETGYQKLEVLTPRVMYAARWVYADPKTGEKVRKVTSYYLFRAVGRRQVKTPGMEEEGLDGAWFTFEEAIRKVKFGNLKEVLMLAADMLAS